MISPGDSAWVSSLCSLKFSQSTYFNPEKHHHRGRGQLHKAWGTMYPSQSNTVAPIQFWEQISLIVKVLLQILISGHRASFRLQTEQVPMSSSSSASRCQPVKRRWLTENRTTARAQRRAKIVTSHIQAMSTIMGLISFLFPRICIFPVISVGFGLIHTHFEKEILKTLSPDPFWDKEILKNTITFFGRYLDCLSWQGLGQAKESNVLLPEWGAWEK